MAELKTKPTKASAAAFIRKVTDPARRADCQTVLEMMRRATGAEPTMWGPSIVGFGRYTYRYQSGRALEWFITGFSPRKADLTLYFVGGVQPHAALLARLGKHKTGRGCLYLKKLSDVDQAVLRELIEQAVRSTPQVG